MIEVRRVTYAYDKECRALEDVNMDFDKGKIIGVIGVNGSGKSTLFQSIVGLLKPDKGEILCEGMPIRYDKKSLYELRKKVGMVFQDPDKQIFYDNVYEDIAFALRNMKLDETEIKKRIEEALERVGGIEWQKRGVHFLSHGQKKRVAIASVLAMKQQLILMDEPTAGLDPRSVRKMVQIIKEIASDGTKVVISSHDMDLIYEICDYIYVLEKGKVISEGKIEEVFSKDNTLEEIGLSNPWLVKVHKYMGLPLFRTEKELYKYYEKQRSEA
nr:ATP-binding cassette domain-containing protein [uncultured Cellulosilyticum sp.]